ncbi:hypothetical protein DK59_3069 [Brucella abortus bv. 4 str. 292]|nr:hypothetical protein DK59_3069 [Brucella abortus bv. 4 str. 292]
MPVILVGQLFQAYRCFSFRCILRAFWFTPLLFRAL